MESILAYWRRSSHFHFRAPHHDDRDDVLCAVLLDVGAHSSIGIAPARAASSCLGRRFRCTFLFAHCGLRCAHATHALYVGRDWYGFMDGTRNVRHSNIVMGLTCGIAIRPLGRFSTRILVELRCGGINFLCDCASYRATFDAQRGGAYTSCCDARTAADDARVVSGSFVDITNCERVCDSAGKFGGGTDHPCGGRVALRFFADPRTRNHGVVLCRVSMVGGNTKRRMAKPRAAAVDDSLCTYRLRLDAVAPRCRAALAGCGICFADVC
jgi:hypothetical protein